MIERIRRYNWADYLVLLAFIAVVVITIILVATAALTRPSRSNNEYCQTETYFSFPQYYFQEVCITPVPH